MNNDIVQLTDKNGNNVFPIAGAATQDSISKSMLEEGVFEGTELSPAPSEAYVRTENIVDGAVTSDKIDSATLFKDITNDFTWSETNALSKQAWLVASKFVLINYMGDDVTHAPGQRIADIPAGYRPAVNLWEIANYAGYPGNIVVGSNGELNCNSVGSQAQGRVLFSILYPIA